MAKTKNVDGKGGKKDLAKREEAQLPVAVEDLEVMSGQGFEDTDKDAYAIPFLRVLQSNSPQVNEDEPSYIKGVKPGMIFNTVTGELFGKSVKIIPVHYMRDFVEWQPNRGGFVKTHGNDPVILERIAEIDDKNNSILDNGNIIQDARNHYVLIADRLELGPVILSLTSTGIRHSKKWMTLMNALRIPNSSKVAPMFAGIWEISTIMNENDEGKWYQIGNKSTTCIEFKEWVNKEQLDAAIACRNLVMSGDTKADYESTVDKNTQSKDPNESTKIDPKEDDIPL